MTSRIIRDSPNISSKDIAVSPVMLVVSYHIVIAVNIALSYFTWVLISKLFYPKIKKPPLYVLILTSLYAIPAIYFIVTKYSPVSLLALTTSFTLAIVFTVTGLSFLKLILIPVPLIFSAMYEELVVLEP